MPLLDSRLHIHKPTHCRIQRIHKHMHAPCSTREFDYSVCCCCCFCFYHVLWSHTALFVSFSFVLIDSFRLSFDYLMLMFFAFFSVYCIVSSKSHIFVDVSLIYCRFVFWRAFLFKMFHLILYSIDLHTHIPSTKSQKSKTKLQKTTERKETNFEFTRDKTITLKEYTHSIIPTDQTGQSTVESVFALRILLNQSQLFALYVMYSSVCVCESGSLVARR